MTTYEPDVATLRAMPRRQLALFATGCVVRAAPLVDVHGTEPSRRRLAEGVAALWAGLGELAPADADRHQLAYDQAPENSPDVEDDGDPR
jgi:hypothetical protein